ncbi:MAG: aminopeptidase [Lachnospiraceae bacterium]|nr:aminopeptidase [Lachnospiraceae bacterium]
MRDTFFYKESQDLLERLDLLLERIPQIPEEGALPPALQPFFAEVTGYIRSIYRFNSYYHGEKKFSASEEDWKGIQEKLFFHMMPEHYADSYLNPAKAVADLGQELGGMLSAVYADLMAMNGWLAEGRLDLIVMWGELYVQIYGCIAGDCADRGECTLSEEAIADVQDAIYWFYHDNLEIMQHERTVALIDEDYDFFRNIVMHSDLEDPCYLYQYGTYISDNERKLSQYMNQLSQEEIDSMASTYTEGYRIGFEVAGKPLHKKRTVDVEFPIGMERMVRKAVENFEAMGLECTMYREGTLSMTNRGRKRGVYATAVNKQFDYDHKDDKGYYYDKRFVERRLEVMKDSFEKNKDKAKKHGGPAVVEVFGEPKFDPINKPENYKYTDDQNQLNVYDMSESSQILYSYIPGEERSFTIIAYPLPCIGDRFEEIFSEVVKINTLDYKLYQEMQQKIIDLLDQGERVHVKGSGANQTDITVMLHPLTDPSKETIFENCVADVNIPVGEVFTSPVLEGTNGVLHVSQVYLGEYSYENLKITFEDGKIKDYTCTNFPTEEENRKYIFDNVLYKHDTLPIGEFAIGTNTTAYTMARKYGIADKLPILIAEKTGPHFAVGDTCYSQEEEVHTFNPDGKEIIAKENSCSVLRKEDMSKAYFNCHTDITIPYDELELIEVLCKDGRRLPIIRDGRFVVAGCEELNKPLDA